MFWRSSLCDFFFGQAGIYAGEEGFDITVKDNTNLKGGVIDSLSGATLAALGENGSVILSGGRDITMGTDALTAKKDMTENADNYLRTYRKTETANTITAGKDVTIAAGNNLKMRNTTAVSENGAVTVQAANNVTVPAPGLKDVVGVGGAVIGDRAKDYIKDRLETDCDKETVKGSRG